MKARDRLADKIEVTEAMIEAGEDALLSELGGAVIVHWNAREMAKKVFLAMREALPNSCK